MKQLIFIIAICMTPYIAVAQAGPPPKVSKIKFLNDSSKTSNFDVVVKSLIADGYEIKDKDAEYGTITTVPRRLEKLNGSYYFYIRVSDGEIIISGQCCANLTINMGGGVTRTVTYTPISNSGAKFSIKKLSWNEMDAFVSKLQFKQKFYLL